jgi:hypothetical protein
MTVDSASQCILSVLIPYFIIKSKYFTGTAGFITVWQNVWYSSVIRRVSKRWTLFHTSILPELYVVCA